MERVKTTDRLRQLRVHMARMGIDVYIIPAEDAHSSEYTAPTDARQAFISGFTGSSGMAFVSTDNAALATDSRYFEQAANQLDENWTILRQGLPNVPSWEDWMSDQAANGKTFGIDPTVISLATSHMLDEEIKSKGGKGLISVADNLIDRVWSDQKPSRPDNAVRSLSLKYAGKDSKTKIEELQQVLEKKKAAGIVITGLDEIAWLFNLRGNDIPYNPVFFSYAVTTPTSATLYINESKLDQEAKQNLGGVSLRPYTAIFSDLKALSVSGQDSAQDKRKFMISARASWAITCALGKDNVDEVQSPIADAKAVKNSTEMQGMRNCHIRDGAALSEFFAWLEDKLVFQKETVNEFEAAHKLETIRQKHELYVSLSFATISSTGANAAIMHYEPDRNRSADIDPNAIYLCDSGAQYYDGTTDTTRTLHFGCPTSKEKEAYTLVLKGHIALDRAVFPKNTTGLALDILARQYLWQNGMDYSHATGHGVGSFLNVHEGPIGIGRGIKKSGTALAAGNVLSNEPGYYQDKEFGVRIENVLLVEEVATKYQSGTVPYYGVKHVTMVPMCRKLIDMSLLTAQETEWLNKYHEEVFKSIKDFFMDDSRTMQWLLRECAAY